MGQLALGVFAGGLLLLVLFQQVYAGPAIRAYISGLAVLDEHGDIDTKARADTNGTVVTLDKSSFDLSRSENDEPSAV